MPRSNIWKRFLSVLSKACLVKTLIKEETKRVWPNLCVRTARKNHPCDNCRGPIAAGEVYIDPGDSNPDRIGGFGGYRFCSGRKGLVLDVCS
jgi:hypothetical protein